MPKEPLSTHFSYPFQNNLIYNNPEKRKIALDMLERYTGSEAAAFQPYIILTNFHKYLKVFQERAQTASTSGSAFSAVHDPRGHISMIDFKIGAPTAAMIIEMLSTIEPQAVLFLGMCGGLHRSLQLGDFILPMAAIRDEGVSGHFIPPQVPSLPTFKIQKFVSQIIVENGLDYRTGVVHTTDYRFWEFDDTFKAILYEERAIGIDMECAALFSVGFVSKVPIGALLLVSDLPLQKGGIKTKESSRKVFSSFTEKHIEIGISAMTEIQKRGEHIRHYRW
ncbi:MAG TPA: AMP nucleosidase [bacterium]|nr:AMP nucleosidase [bacterium]HQG46680.1 AMP nucleosidase [bacterium]HQI48985.1 AMP nucleosidase [bacterium]HQJ63849.1 AMP nucleosidase [bacterium]